MNTSNSTLRESYLAILARLAILVGILAWLAFTQFAQFPRATTLENPAEVSSAPIVAVPKAIEPEQPQKEQEVAQPELPKEKEPEFDNSVLLVETIAQGLEDHAQVRENRLQSEQQANQALQKTWSQWQSLVKQANQPKPVPQIRDAPTRIPLFNQAIQASERQLIALKTQKDQIKGESQAYQAAPRPAAQPLRNHNPFAKPPEGDEFHFELRNQRVAFIDIQKLVSMMKIDAKVRVRLMDRPKTIDGEVGPVGAFTMKYETGPLLDSLLEDRSGSRSVTYSLRGWEIVPQRNDRGETFDAAVQPASDFSRTIRLLSRERDAVTLWVYPDAFPLYRQLCDWLHQQGITVAARPLPQDTPIRGSPSGSMSAGQ